ncbi:oxidoreductase [Litoreibacter roseus]|uniref:Short-chain dehydrogenase/reductase n=1 Tax=Litoreibacter roseus TaxID=2601869 RepID=A0A6N6JCG4_9RHOB|nr:oxidoreductase [Litoreibacter roseus]GFE63530.1 short-chain dehydrogenase/reductase [Litoreibacter roseus]
MTNKVFFITGVSSGIGRALAETVLAAGESVAGTLRNTDQIAAFEALAPGRAKALIADVTDRDSVEQAVSDTVATFGRIDVIANNAGAGTVGAVEETSEAEARSIFDLNFFGQFNVIQAALPVLRKQKSGHILTFSAVGGFTGFPGLGVYSAAKAAADVMSEALAQEVASFGIRTTILTLGIFRTKFAAGSLRFTDAEMVEYAETPAGKFRGFIGGLDGKQPNNPEKAAQAILQIVEAEDPPLHLALGQDAVGVMSKKLDQIKGDIDRWKTLSASTVFSQAAV